MPRDLLSLERDSRDWNVAPRAAYFSPTRPPSSRLHPPLISLPLAPSFFHRCRYATKAFEILSPRLTYNNNVNFLRAEKRFVSMGRGKWLVFFFPSFFSFSSKDKARTTRLLFEFKRFSVEDAEGGNSIRQNFQTGKHRPCKLGRGGLA